MNPSKTMTSPMVFGPTLGGPASAVDTQKNFIQRIGFVTLLIYLFALLSLLTEVTTELFGFKPYVSIVVGPATIVLSLVSAQPLRLLKSRIGVYTVLFLVCLLLAAPFSTYKTGTIETLIDAFFRSYSIVFAMAALAPTVQDCKRIIYVIVAAGFVVFLVNWFYGAIGADGRFGMSFGSLTNPNDLATHLLFILPFCLMIAAVTRHTGTVRPVAVILALLMLYISFKTASRSAMISVVVMSLVLLVKASNTQRFLAVVCLAGLLGISVVLLPGSVWQRFATTYSDDNREGDLGYGAASRDGRIQLLKRSLEVTFTHPVFGVGPGVFITYEANQALQYSKHAAWLGTHNSYTQVSAEDGIPAFIFFVASIVAALRACAQVYKLAAKRVELKELSDLALFLTVAIVGLGANMFFSHIAYRFYLPTVLGLSVSLQLAAKERLKATAMPQPLRLSSSALPGGGAFSRPTQVVATTAAVRFLGVRQPKPTRLR